MMKSRFQARSLTLAAASLMLTPAFVPAVEPPLPTYAVKSTPMLSLADVYVASDPSLNADSGSSSNSSSTPAATVTAAPAAPAAGTAPASPAPAPADAPPASAAAIDPGPPETSPILPEANGPAPAPVPPSQNVTINLINRLVQKGVLSQGEAEELIRQAEDDATIARAQAAAVAETQAVVQAQAAMTPAEPDSDEVRVTYIPETVKAQIRDQIRSEVMEQAKEEKWAAPNSFPEWTDRIKIYGDIRTRVDSINYPTGNANSGFFPNFNAINSTLPYDESVTNPSLYPTLNTDQDRERMRLRVRLGFDIDFEDGFTGGIRLATGGGNSPVSTNQTLGSTGSQTGQGGNFSRYEIWLDRAFIKYESGRDPDNRLTLWFGRFDNPFFTASQIMWDEDVGMDGFAMKVAHEVADDSTLFFTAGAFPIFNSDLNFSSNNTTKFESSDKYLYAAQLGMQIKPIKEIEAKMALSYYHFQDVEGRLSEPYDPVVATDGGSTDNTRPAFAQKGNTYRRLRNIRPTANNNFGATNNFQYYGLATRFHQIAWAGRVDFNFWEPVQVSLMSEFVKNLAFNQDEINSFAVNNGGAGGFEGGDTAWYMGLQVGKPVFEKLGDWSAGISYRYVESDAVIDGFNDSVFGGGGTNMKGYTIGASMALSKRTFLRLSYMSATQIAGPQLRSDVILFDFNAKF